MKRIRPAPHGTRVPVPAPVVAHRDRGGGAQDLPVWSTTAEPEGEATAKRQEVREEVSQEAGCEEDGRDQEGNGKEGSRRSKAAAKRKPSPRRQGKVRGSVWDRKSILTDFGWE